MTKRKAENIDKLNRFPFSLGMERRTVRSADYRLCIYDAFSILLAYDNFACNGVSVAGYLRGKLNSEIVDNVWHSWNYERDFSYLYAAEIDRGNQELIDALKDLILSENNSAYLTCANCREPGKLFGSPGQRRSTSGGRRNAGHSSGAQPEKGKAVSALCRRRPEDGRDYVQDCTVSGG